MFVIEPTYAFRLYPKNAPECQNGSCDRSDCAETRCTNAEQNLTCKLDLGPHTLDDLLGGEVLEFGCLSHDVPCLHSNRVAFKLASTPTRVGTSKLLRT